jgi:hypothetical protein
LLNNRGQVYARALLNWSNAERAIGMILKESNRATEGVPVPDALPIGPPTSVTAANRVRGSMDTSSVNGEIPSTHQNTNTAITSGSTRATDGSELLEKNQVVQRPHDADQMNVNHGYGAAGLHVGNGAASTTSTNGVPSSERPSSIHANDSGIGEPTNVHHDVHVADEEKKLTNSSIADSVGSGMQSAGQSIAHKGEQIQEDYGHGRVDDSDEKSRDLQQQVLHSLNTSGVTTGDTRPEHIDVKVLPSTSNTLSHQVPLSSSAGESVVPDDRPSAVPTDIPARDDAHLRHVDSSSVAPASSSMSTSSGSAHQVEHADEQKHDTTTATAASASTSPQNDANKPFVKRVMNSILG